MYANDYYKEILMLTKNYIRKVKKFMYIKVFDLDMENLLIIC